MGAPQKDSTNSASEQLPALLQQRVASPQRQAHLRRMSTSLPVLFSSKPGLADVQSSEPKDTLPMKAVASDGRSCKGRAAYLPLWPACETLQHLYRLAWELAALWEEARVSEEQRHKQTEIVAAAASGQLQHHIKACGHYLEDLSSRCEAVKKAAHSKLSELVGELSREQVNALDAQLQEAAALPLHERLVALQAVQNQIDNELQHVAYLNRAVADARRVLGLNEEISASMDLAAGRKDALLRDEVPRLIRMLRERRAQALHILGRASLIDDEPKESQAQLRALVNEVEHLEAVVLAMRKEALAAAARARVIWEELGEPPKFPRDHEAVRLSVTRLDGIEDCIVQSMADAVQLSLSAWQSSYTAAEAEQARLHKALRAFGSVEVVEEIIATLGSLHCDDLAACRRQLDNIMVSVLADERLPRENLMRLYQETSLGTAAFRSFEASLDSAESREARRQMLVQKTEELERYLLSLQPILSPLRELKALVVAAVAFESNIQAGPHRFAGNAVHFLEEERFRRRFGQRYPELIDRLVEAITCWEHDENRRFMHHGLELREGLVSIQGQELTLVRVKGDLSCMNHVVDLLRLAEKVRRPSKNQRETERGASVPPARLRARSRSSSHLRKESRLSCPGTSRRSSPTASRSQSQPASPQRPRHKRAVAEPLSAPTPPSMGPLSPQPPAAPRAAPSPVFDSVRVVNGAGGQVSHLRRAWL